MDVYEATTVSSTYRHSFARLRIDGDQALRTNDTWCVAIARMRGADGYSSLVCPDYASDGNKQEIDEQWRVDGRLFIVHLVLY